MGLYIKPAEQAAQQGRKVELRGTLAATNEQLQSGERLAAVAKRAHGNVALLIDGEGDFRAVQSSQTGLIGVYAIPATLAATAS